LHAIHNSSDLAAIAFKITSHKKERKSLSSWILELTSFENFQSKQTVWWPVKTKWIVARYPINYKNKKDTSSLDQPLCTQNAREGGGTKLLNEHM
jgi:hypothetical protein